MHSSGPQTARLLYHKNALPRHPKVFCFLQTLRKTHHRVIRNLFADAANFGSRQPAAGMGASLPYAFFILFLLQIHGFETGQYRAFKSS